jgi:hypothetical protein
MGDEINEKELPKEGNSNARIYPPVEEAAPENREDDPKQPESGDAAADRGEGPEPNDAM